MACSYALPNGDLCPTQNVPDPTGDNQDFCAFHVPLDEKSQWTKDAQNKFTNYMTHGEHTRSGKLIGAQIPDWFDFNRVQWPPDQVDLSHSIVDGDVAFTNRGGTMNLQQSYISGGLTFSNCKLTGTELSGIEVNNATTLQRTKAGPFTAIRAKFLGGLSLKDACNLVSPNFSGAEFGTEGEDGIAFSATKQTEFSGESSNFHGCTMWAMARLDMSFQTTIVDFARSEFFSDATFVEATFCNQSADAKVSFDAARFLKSCSFKNAVFYGPATLRDLEISDVFNIEGANFTCPVSISANSKFNRISAEGAHFNNFELSGVMTNIVDFRRATFHAPAKFKGRFKSKALFADAVFQHHLELSDVIFEKTADFSTTKNLSFRSVSAERTKFNGNSNFDNRVFEREVSFDDAVFEVAPRFYGATLHPSITFGDIHKFKDVSKAAIKRYQTLRHKCEELRSRHEEGMFHSLEQRARCKSKTMPRTDRFFSVLYDLVSVYGTSLFRPIFALLVVWGLFTLFFALDATNWRIEFDAPIDWSEVGKAGLSSASNIFTPFYKFRQSGGWEAASYLGQSLISVPLIAVFILGLRWRFRRG